MTLIKNLLKMEKQLERTLRDKHQSNLSLKYFIIYLRSKGIEPETVRRKLYCLNNLINHNVNLDNPKAVTETLLNQQEWGKSYKRSILYAYKDYCEFIGLTWNPPVIKRDKPKDSWIPTKQMVYQLIDALPKKKSIFIHLLAETGMRGYEAELLKWSDVDFERHIINVKTVKNGNPRTLSITNMHGILTKDVFGRLNLLPKVADRIFGNNKYYSIRNDFKSLSKRIAHKLDSPDIARITPHRLRHYAGTKLYIATRDLMTVKYLLGHVNIQSTVRYVHLAEAYIKEPTNFIVKIANTDDEQIELMEQGFELCGKSVSGKPILRKPK